MVWRHAVTNQSERHGEPVDDGDLHRYICLLAESLGGVYPGRPSSHNGDDER